MNVESINNLISISESYKKYRFVFVTDALGSVTCFMKCVLPCKVLQIYGIESIVLEKNQLLEYTKHFQKNDVLILSKLQPWARDEKISQTLLNIKEKVFKIYCEPSEAGSFDCFLDKYDMCHENLDLINNSVIDGYLFETEELKKLMQSKLKDKNNFYFTRHVHSNCHKFLNPFSGIGNDDYKKSKNRFDLIKSLSVQYCKQINNIKSIGYIGRPKYCHDYLALNIANYELSHKTSTAIKFISSNPGPNDNISDTLKIDFGFSLINPDIGQSDLYYNYKTSNKVNALWSLGIPGLFSPLPSYLKVFEENLIDYDYWSIPNNYTKHECQIKNSQSLGRAISEKIHTIITDVNFHKKRMSLFNSSLRYNPMNIFWLYQEMFDSLEK